MKKHIRKNFLTDEHVIAFIDAMSAGKAFTDAVRMSGVALPLSPEEESELQGLYGLKRVMDMAKDEIVPPPEALTAMLDALNDEGAQVPARSDARITPPVFPDTPVERTGVWLRYIRSPYAPFAFAVPTILVALFMIRGNLSETLVSGTRPNTEDSSLAIHEYAETSTFSVGDGAPSETAAKQMTTLSDAALPEGSVPQTITMKQARSISPALTGGDSAEPTPSLMMFTETTTPVVIPKTADELIALLEGEALADADVLIDPTGELATLTIDSTTLLDLQQSYDENIY